MWGIITVQMLNLGFPFTQAELFTLTAIAGISGATMRIPASFLIRLAGGRNTIFLTTAMLLAPAIGTGIVLQHPEWPLWSFPADGAVVGRRWRQLRLVDVQHQHLLPEAPAGHRPGPERGPGQLRRDDDAGRHPAGDDGRPLRRARRRADDPDQGQRLDLRQDPAGTPTWIQNAGFAWVLSLVPLSIAVLVRHEQPEDGVARHRQPAVAFAKITYLYTLAFVPSIFMLWLYLPAPTGLGVLNMWVAIPLDIIAR
jgi:NNP family nitrate/nitrite transporter-like MFS transporter